MTTTANRPAPPGPFLRGATTGCLALLLLPACLLVWFWYTVWHNGRVNREAAESAEASVLLRARQEGVVLSGGPIEVDRCFTLTARRRREHLGGAAGRLLSPQAFPKTARGSGRSSESAPVCSYNP
ncbi:hypothetical protein [Streptomyces sp. NPDC003717]|uniref:hypothetical protein n=1 Tax=Streptomyces sp. NPDC003717 TaxID=3154276 RepID=UPI0033A913EC